MSAVNFIMTYFIYFIGGIFGLHHFYLGRNVHGFVMMITLGGFIVGWIRDFFQIPRYIRESQNSNNERHKQSLCRTFAEFIMSLYFPVLFRIIFPVTYFKSQYTLFLSKLVIPALLSLGILLVGNAGNSKMPRYKPVLLTSYASSAVIFLNEEYLMVISLITSFIAHKYNQPIQLQLTAYPNKPKTKSKRLVYIVVTVCLGIFIISLWMNYLILEINVNINGKETKLRDSIDLSYCFNFAYQLASSIYGQYRSLGLWGMLHNIHKFIADPDGTKEAYNFLGLDTDASIDEIRRRCRHLSSKSHPDRFSDATVRETQLLKYNEIRSHCDHLIKSN